MDILSIIVYVLFIIKEACYCFALFLHYFVLYHLQIMYLKQGLIMEKIIFIYLICTLLSCQENRPHGNQYNLPELTQTTS